MNSAGMMVVILIGIAVLATRVLAPSKPEWRDAFNVEIFDYGSIDDDTVNEPLYYIYAVKQHRLVKPSLYFYYRVSPENRKKLDEEFPQGYLTKDEMDDLYDFLESRCERFELKKEAERPFLLLFRCKIIFTKSLVNIGTVMAFRRCFCFLWSNYAYIFLKGYA